MFGKRIKATFYLKSGQSFSVYLNKIVQSKNSLDEFSKLEWWNASHGLPSIFQVDLSDVSAIVTQHLRWWQK